MKIIKFELLKIITNKLFIIIFLILLALNIIFLNYQNYRESKNDIPYKAYKILESELKGKTNEEKGKYINEIYEYTNAINTIYIIETNLKNEDTNIKNYAKNLLEENKELYDKYYKKSKNPELKYTGNIYSELSFLEKIKNDYDKVNNYQKTLDSILEKSKTLKNISIFKNPDEISQKNITKTSKAYETMLNTNVNYEVGKSLEKISSVSITDFFILILIFIISTIIITEEKEKNLFSIIKITKNGKIKTIIAKIVSLFICTLSISILFYGINLFYYLIKLGYGNIFANIQSVSSFQLSTLKLNILEYILLLFSTKCIYIFLVSLLMFYLAIKFNNHTENLLILSIIIIINFVLFKNINLSSSINIFKYFNLINLINTNDIYNTYENLRIFNILLSKTSTLLSLQVITITLLIIFSVIKYSKNMKVIIKENKLYSKLKSIKIVKNIKFNNIFTFETYKFFIINKCFIVIILFSLFIGIKYKSQNFNLSYNEIFYKNYMNILTGKLTPEKEKLILNTIEEYDKASIQLEFIEEQVKKGEISKIEGMLASQPYEETLSTRQIFEKVKDNYNYIKENPKSSFIYDTGYNKLFRIDETINEYDIYLIITTIIMLSSLFIMEYKTGFIFILNTTKKGRLKTAESKVIVSLIACTIIYIISIIPEILKTSKTYGLDCMNMPLISLASFHNFPSNISIITYLLLFYIVKYISYILVILIIEYISLKLKNNIFTFITSIFILLTPYILNVLKIAHSNLFPLINLSIIGKNLFYIIFIPLIVIINIFMYNNVIKKLE